MHTVKTAEAFMKAELTIDRTKELPRARFQHWKKNC